MRVPKSKGKISTNRQGRILLTNPEGKTVGVHETLAYIWEQANGNRQIKEIADNLVEELGLENEEDAQREKDNVILAIRNLEKQGLLEYVEKKH